MLSYRENGLNKLVKFSIKEADGVYVIKVQRTNTEILEILTIYLNNATEKSNFGSGSLDTSWVSKLRLNATHNIVITGL